MAFSLLRSDLNAALERDPAARGRLEVVLAYSGFHAIILYRLAHRVHRLGLRTPARLLMTFARILTGIEIHPAARIGRGFFIDHGTGVVIGETAEIGDNVTLYQGVTLGGISPAENARAQSGVKRHPTLADNVIIGSGAQVLGPVRVGRCARVGANAVVVREVPDGATVAGIPARVVGVRDDSARFAAYGTSSADLPDPVAPVLAEVRALRSRLAELEATLEEERARTASRDAVAQGGEKPVAEARDC